MSEWRKKPKLYVFLLVLAIIGALTSPFWLWHLKDSSKLDVLIVDKTVPDQTYREHKGLVWLLNHEKYVKDDNNPYSLSKDYFGFKPSSENDYYTTDLPENLSKYEVIYLADQYGVYKEDFNGKNETGKRSENIYGGLPEQEVATIEKALLKGNKTLIAEFNTFGSPTSESARNKISNILNLDWSGWIGRYFKDLNSQEVPVWVKSNYEKRNGQWNYSGEGYVFVDQNDAVVILSEKDLSGSGAEFFFTKAGQKKLGKKLNTTYEYWFDVIESRNPEDVLAKFKLPITKEAQIRLKNIGIPREFPAIISNENAKYSSYYFAGDFADEAEVPQIYQTSGLDYWKQHTGSESSFFWRGYVPMMKQLLKQGLHKNVVQEKIELTQEEGLKINSRTNKDFIEIKQNGKWRDHLIKGVNMGIGKPGHFPGEAAITKEEYSRWFKAIGEMNANAIRVYTLHPPAFYEAFYEYNQLAKKPLYLFHGAWINEEGLVKTQDAFAKENMDDFQTEIKYMIDIVHGKAIVPERKGHAYGKYTHDISPYVLGYMIGIEWDPNMVKNTNLKHKDKQPFKGKYFRSVDASPFEIWLAEMMEYTTSYETEKYDWQHTMSFTNWVTTDLLDHPSEPLEQEDLVAVNPNHIEKTESFHAGLFASYHIYPYYPDFLNLEQKYTSYKDERGEKNNYAGYLNDLRKAHSMPVVVAEFGVPASRGLTHRNVLGMDQGNHSEKEQGQINKKLFESIVSEGYAGGIVFAWQDEWFKRTWNTMDYDNPDRRPFWSNTQTNEQNFGLLSFEPGTKETAIQVDGMIEDWAKNGAKPIYSSKKNKLKNVKMSSDEKYVYFMMENHYPVDFKKDDLYIMLDTIENQGNTDIKFSEDESVKTDFGIDYLIKLEDELESRIVVDSYYDAFHYQYGELLKMIPKATYAKQKDNGKFHPIRLALNKELTIPTTGQKILFQDYETGSLKFGNANPNDKNFDSLTDISINEDQTIIEGRIAWQLLNVKDPSTKEIMGDLWKQGLDGKQKISGIRTAIAVVENGDLKETQPKRINDTLKQEETAVFKWDEWDEPRYYERLKESYEWMKEAYRSIGVEGKDSEEDTASRR